MSTKQPYRRDNLVCVAVTYGQMAAQVYKSKLESAGIPVLLQYESAGLILGLTVDGLGQVRVMVPEDLADEARALLEPNETEPDEITWDEEEDEQAADTCTDE